MTGADPARGQSTLLVVYDDALAQVYGYLVRRCPSRAEDHTAESSSPRLQRCAATQTSITPYLSVRDAEAALAFYTDAFDARVTHRIDMPDGRVGHAEISIAGARVLLADEFPEMGIVGPATLGNTTVALHLDVPDVDAFVAHAVASGATLVREVSDQFHGNRNGVILDPFGHRWMV